MNKDFCVLLYCFAAFRNVGELSKRSSFRVSVRLWSNVSRVDCLPVWFIQFKVVRGFDRQGWLIERRKKEGFLVYLPFLEVGLFFFGPVYRCFAVHFHSSFFVLCPEVEVAAFGACAVVVAAGFPLLGVSFRAE